MKKGLIILLLAAVVFVTGCENRDEDIIDISDIEPIDLSYKMTTELPCVKAEDVYQVERYELDWKSYMSTGRPRGYDGENFYFTRGTTYFRHNLDSQYMTKAVAYNPKTGEEKTLFEKAPTEEEWELFISSAALHNSHFCFFTEKYNSISTDNPEENQLQYDFYDINLTDNTIYTTTVDKMPGSVKAQAKSGNCLYWGDGIEEEGKEEPTFFITRYDMETNTFSTFKREARVPSAYKNGIIYFHNGSIYYCGNEIDPNTGVFYEGDEMLTETDGFIARQYSDNDNIMYRYWCGEWIPEEEDYKCRGFGYFDEKYNRMDIAQGVYESEKSEFNSDFVFASETGLMSFNETYDNTPIIYDIKNNFFAALELEVPSEEHIYGFTTENSVLFYIKGYHDDNSNYFNPVMYEVTRKSNQEEN